MSDHAGGVSILVVVVDGPLHPPIDAGKQMRCSGPSKTHVAYRGSELSRELFTKVEKGIVEDTTACNLTFEIC